MDIISVLRLFSLLAHYTPEQIEDNFPRLTAELKAIQKADGDVNKTAIQILILLDLLSSENDEELTLEARSIASIRGHPRLPKK